MAANIFTLMGSIFVDNEQANKSIAKTSEEGEKSGNILAKLGGTALEVGKKFGEFAVGVATAATGAATALAGIAMKSAESGDRIDKMSQKLGLSREGFQEWDYILSQNGASIDSLGAGMKTLQKTLDGLTEDGDKASEAFAAIGVNFDDIKGKSPEEAFDITVKALQNMPEGAEKATSSMKLLGKQGMELMPLLNQTAEGTEELRQRAHDLGMVMGDEAVDSGVMFGDMLDDAKGMVAGFANQMGATLLPAMTEGLGAFIGFATGAEDGAERFEAAIDGIVDMLSNQVPIFLEKGSEIVIKLVEGIVSAVPKLVDAIMPIIPDVVKLIIDLLPLVVQAGVDILVSVIEGIATALPDLIPAIVDVIMIIVTSIIDNLPKILEAALHIIVALAEGLISSIPVIIKKLPELINAILKFIVGALPQIIDAGIQLFIALVDALPQIIEAIVEVLPEIIAAIVTALISLAPELIKAGFELFVAIVANLPKIIIEIVKAVPKIVTDVIKAFKDKIPEFVNIGKDLINGLIKGVSDLAGKVVDTVKDVGGKIIGGIKGVFGISSPSKVFSGIGKNLGEGFINGIDSMSGAIDRTMDNVFGDLDRDVSVGIDATTRVHSDNYASEMNQADGISNNFNISEPIVREESDTDKIPEFVNIGKDLINGLIKGVSDLAGKVDYTVKDIGEKITGGIERVFDIFYPSKVFAEIGENLVDGFIIGIDKMADKVNSAVKNTVSGFDIDEFSVGINTNRLSSIIDSKSGTTQTASTTQSSSGIPQITIQNMHVRDDKDIEKIARELYLLGERERRGGKVLVR